MNKPEDKYSAEEFFYDESFVDYDIRRNEYYEARTKQLLIDLGQMIHQLICTKKLSIPEFANAINVSPKDVALMLSGKYDFDLRTISKIEAFFQVKLVSFG